MKNKIYYKQEGYQKRRVKFSLILGGLMLIAGLALVPVYVYSQSKADAELFAGDNLDPVVRLANLEREKNGLGLLTYNPQLAQAAKAKAEDMLKNQYFDHYRPADKYSPWDFIANTGYAYRKAGENLAIDFTSVNDAFAAWMKSDTHKKNILDGAFVETGVGYASGEFEGHKTLVVVQMFGRPGASIGAVLGTQR